MYFADILKKLESDSQLKTRNIWTAAKGKGCSMC